MQKLIDELYRFDRRPVYAIYGVPSDFGFACMDKVSIAVDLGFQSRQAGIVTAVAEQELFPCTSFIVLSSPMFTARYISALS